jgi:6-phosphogluconolactonase (cycloisomerase 2 family)
MVDHNLRKALLMTVAAAVLSGCATQQDSVGQLPAVQQSSQPQSQNVAGLTPEPLMYVTLRGNNAIAAFPESAKGNVAPALTIAGPNTLLGSPVTLAVAKSGNIYAANESATQILIFARGATGNARPQLLGGSHFPLAATQGLAVDAAGRLYVSDYHANKIFVFAPNASGNARPIRTIGGNKTLLTDASGMAFDPSGNLYVANYSDSTNPIVEFSKNADGNVAPIATIGGSATGLFGTFNVSIDKGGHIIGANANEIVIFAPGAHGNATPVATIAGSHTGLSEVSSTGVDDKGNIYATNLEPVSGTYEILVFAPKSNGNVRPIRTLGGVMTALSAPFYPTFH